MGRDHPFQGEQWDKLERQWRQPETYTYLDRLKGKIEKMPVAKEVKEAVVQSEGVRQYPELVAGEDPRQAAMPGVMLVRGVVTAQAKEAGQQAVAALRAVLRCLGRASRVGQVATVAHAARATTFPVVHAIDGNFEVPDGQLERVGHSLAAVRPAYLSLRKSPGEMSRRRRNVK